MCPEPQHYHAMCCVFIGYHAVHRAVKSGIIHFPNDVHVDSFSNHKRLLWSVFAEAFEAEAREFATPCRKFSLSIF